MFLLGLSLLLLLLGNWYCFYSTTAFFPPFCFQTISSLYARIPSLNFSHPGASCSISKLVFLPFDRQEFFPGFRPVVRVGVRSRGRPLAGSPVWIMDNSAPTAAVGRADGEGGVPADGEDGCLFYLNEQYAFRVFHSSKRFPT